MKINNEYIDKLLEKYYSGQTTEEENIKLYILLCDEPEDSIYYTDAMTICTMFEMAELNKAEQTTNVEQETNNAVEIKPKRKIIPFIVRAVAVAVLAVGIGWFALSRYSSEPNYAEFAHHRELTPKAKQTLNKAFTKYNKALALYEKQTNKVETKIKNINNKMSKLNKIMSNNKI